MAATMNPVGAALHSAGIFADTGLNGPQIGELVLVVDRAKNLPNRRTMGKQDPYCAARFGKEAKKTDTDRRGGQTPRWKQELKFDVYDSADHHQIKISLFNDDKKTDLIGETMINLDHILNHGGGQSDDWHTLHCKGKYAGEILIEFTFYDHRPREENPKHATRERKQSNAAPQNQSPTAVGPRPEPVVKRRPLPSDPGRPLPHPDATRDLSQPAASNQQNVDEFDSSQNDSYATYLPRVEPEQYHEHAQDPHPAPLAPASQASPDFLPSHELSGASVAPLRTPRVPAQHVHQSGRQMPQNYSNTRHATYVEHDYTNESPMFDPYSSSPYSFEAQQVQYSQQQPAAPLGISPPRHGRVEALSASAPRRPQPYGLPHAHSDPTFGPHQRTSLAGDQASDYSYDQSYNTTTPGRNVQISSQNHGAYNSQPSSPIEYRRNAEPDYAYPSHSAPVHRNSAPTIPYSTPHHPHHISAYAPQPLQIESRTIDTNPGTRYQYQPNQRHSYQSFSPVGRGRPLPQPETTFQPQGRRMTAESRQLPPVEIPIRRSTQIEDDGTTYDQFRTFPSSNDIHAGRTQPRGHYSAAPGLRGEAQYGPTTSRPPRPYSLVESSPSQHSTSQEPSRFASQQDLPQHIPAVTTMDQGSMRLQQGQPQVHRKSVSPQPTPPSTKRTSVPFSPDSYNDFNPNSTRSSPAQPNSKEPSPMYTTQKSSETKTSETSEKGANGTGPIVRNDGAVVDPSDHLPGHTWAPEPESTGKQKRPTTVVNIKRFGPREAPKTPPSVRTPGSAKSGTNTPESGFNASGANRLQKRTPSGNSPLSPTMPTTLNAATNSPYPPPVPAKIPLNSSRSGIEDYEPGGSMAALSEEMRNIDIGPSKASTVNFQRVRKTRFGV